jgi:glutamate-1-semialdehyde 2,1-aminomutase
MSQMPQRDYSRLVAEMSEEYHARSPRSAQINERANRVMVDGGSHNLRLMQPFPPRIAGASGAWLQDVDGHRILDFWQGHFANILGHNPPVISRVLAEAYASGQGLQTGFTDELQIEAAELLCACTGAESVRFTTSGSLATMYAIMLARAYTERDLVLKIGGGWHGAQPWGLKGGSFRRASAYDHADSYGLPPAISEGTLVTRFNDPQMLEDQFRSHGDRIACFIVEPFVGAGGGIPARREYLRTARRLTEQFGAVLILDEVIAGFRFRAGDMGALYGVKPDLWTFGKIMGGGMPVTAVAGRADILGLAGRPGGGKVRFSGGTYSAHPASLLAAKTMMGYLKEHEAEIYPRLGELGRKAAGLSEAAFRNQGIYARCTGQSDELSGGSSFVLLHFPYDHTQALERPEDVMDPAVCDHELSEQVLKLALLLDDVYIEHGLGAISTAHCEEDLRVLAEACARAAARVKPYLG